jgi:hypothetical protein
MKSKLRPISDIDSDRESPDRISCQLLFCNTQCPFANISQFSVSSPETIRPKPELEHLLHPPMSGIIEPDFTAILRFLRIEVPIRHLSYIEDPRRFLVLYSLLILPTFFRILRNINSPEKAQCMDKRVDGEELLHSPPQEFTKWFVLLSCRRGVFQHYSEIRFNVSSVIGAKILPTNIGLSVEIMFDPNSHLFCGCVCVVGTTKAMITT